METFTLEIETEKRLRRHPWLIPTVTLVTGLLLYLLVIICGVCFTKGLWWVVIPAGVFVHSFFIVTVHDASHKAITRGKWDSIIMNFAAGLMLLPFYAEPFRKYHLVHHSNTNTASDPLWPEVKTRLFRKSRWVYLLCELIPLGFTLFLLLSSGKKRNNDKTAHTPRIRWNYMLFAFSVTALVLYIAQPPLSFFLGTLFTVNIVKLVRHWCEHMGDLTGKESNTYRFPLGMGIGNHEAHHSHPHFCWLTMALCLRSRKKDTNPLKAVAAILFDSRFHHYQAR